MNDKTKKAVAEQTLAVAGGFALGTVSGHAISPRPGGRTPPLAMQVASTMGAAAANGAGLGGTLAAGTALITAKVTAGMALAAVAAPYVLGAAFICGATWGMYKLLEALDG